MDLILWRHAEAEEGGPDLARALTGKGRKQAARVAEWLQQRLPAKFTLLASPAVRAQQTAEALGVKIRTVERLAPGAARRPTSSPRPDGPTTRARWWWSATSPTSALRSPHLLAERKATGA